MTSCFVTVRWCALIFVLQSLLMAQAGNGGNGDLDATPMVVTTNFTLSVSGGASQPFSVFVSDSPGALAVPGIGNVWLDIFSPGFGVLWEGVLNGSGTASVGAFIPNDQTLLGFVAYVQGVVGDPAFPPSGLALTRAIRIDFESPDSFVILPPISTQRAFATADLLADGRVLVTGGGVGSLFAAVGTSTTEIYLPFLRTWSAGPAMSVQRAAHASAALADGRMLITGGASASGAVTATCEIFDPSTNTFAPAAPMGSPRAGHLATTLLDGRVLVTGGTGVMGGPALIPTLSASLPTGEVYDPVTNAWTAVSNPMASKRFAHEQVRLPDGRVFCISGMNGAVAVFGSEIPTFTATTSLYDPATNSFIASASIPSGGRGGHRATLMPNGEVFVGGGMQGGGLTGTGFITNSAWRYASATGSWIPAGVTPTAVAFHGQVLLNNGKMHLSGGVTGQPGSPSQITTCATRVEGASSFTTTTPLPTGTSFHRGIRLHDGSVLIVGGSFGAGTTTLLYTPTP